MFGSVNARLMLEVVVDPFVLHDAGDDVLLVCPGDTRAARRSISSQSIDDPPMPVVNAPPVA